MSDKNESSKRAARLGRIFNFVQVTDEDLERASQILDKGCPRRYCWWWKSLAFQWEISPIEGCTWLESKKPDHWKFTSVPCCRCDSSSVIDHFEPREPQIEADGIDASGWEHCRKKNHEEYPG